MKKFLALLLTLSISLGVLTACSSNTPKDNDSENQVTTNGNGETNGGEKEITVGASPTPHAEILAEAKKILKDKGYTLNVIEFTDYIQPNLALDSGEIDANYFQHKPYLDNFNAERGTKLVSVANIHYEPFGIYSDKIKDLSELPNGASISVPNDGTNEARALILLENLGFIKLKDGVGLNATVRDIVEDNKDLTIIEMAAESLAIALPDVDAAVINGNYALAAGFNVNKDALAKEDENSAGAEVYPNIIAVREGHEEDEKIKVLIETLESPEVKEFIENTYNGAVVPCF